MNPFQGENHMNTHFHIEFKTSNGNLHVHPKGDFDGRSALELVTLIHEQYNGEGRVFIDTHRLREMHPSGCNTFRHRLDENRLPADRLFFKGEKGFEIAPQGSRVIVPPKEHRCQCSKNCANCPCSGKVDSD